MNKKTGKRRECKPCRHLVKENPRREDGKWKGMKVEVCFVYSKSSKEADEAGRE